jgi:hypothetical protein
MAAKTTPKIEVTSILQVKLPASHGSFDESTGEFESYSIATGRPVGTITFRRDGDKVYAVADCGDAYKIDADLLTDAVAALNA